MGIIKSKIMKLVFLVLLLASYSYSSTWTYTNQGAWSGTWAICGNGSNQSPIDLKRTEFQIDMTTKRNLPGSYKSLSDLKIKNSGGHTFKISGSFGTTTFNSKEYTMAQFHTHQPSEHTFDGMRYDMEMHFVHQQGTAADYLVLTAFFNIGPEESEFLKEIKYSAGSSTADAEVAITDSINPWDVLGKIQGNKEYITYYGSFTTPPCTEGVNFVLFRDF